MVCTGTDAAVQLLARTARTSVPLPVAAAAAVRASVAAASSSRHSSGAAALLLAVAATMALLAAPGRCFCVTAAHMHAQQLCSSRKLLVERLSCLARFVIRIC